LLSGILLNRISSNRRWSIPLLDGGSEVSERISLSLAVIVSMSSWLWEEGACTAVFLLSRSALATTGGVEPLLQ